MKRTKKTSKSVGFNPCISQNVEIVMEKEIVSIIENCIKNSIFYGVFPVSGDSMTCSDKRSIPDGSGILVYDLQIDCSLPLIENSGKIPMGEPLVLALRNKKGKIGYFVKTITFIDTVYNNIRLTSYNPHTSHRNWWIVASCIERIFKIIQVIKKEDLLIRNIH
ncbi:hypothetical protein [Pedobacter sp. NJ-S-72]